MGPRTTRSALVEDVDLGEGQHPLVLRIGELEQLEEIVGAGIMTIFRNLTNGDWKVSEVRNVIRLGLIGGGMAPYEASGMVNRLITEGYLMHYFVIAQAVIHAAVAGYEDQLPGEPQTPPEMMPTN